MAVDGGEVRLDIEEGRPRTDEETAMARFYEDIDKLKANIASIRGMQREVKDLNETGKTLVKTKDVHQHREEMQVRG